MKSNQTGQETLQLPNSSRGKFDPTVRERVSWTEREKSERRVREKRRGEQMFLGGGGGGGGGPTEGGGGVSCDHNWTTFSLPRSSLQQCALPLLPLDGRGAQHGPDGFVEHCLKAALRQSRALQILDRTCGAAQRKTTHPLIKKNHIAR